MEDKKNSKIEYSRYFDEMLIKIREIRTSERSAWTKITDILVAAYDYNEEDGRTLLMRYQKFLNEKEYRERFANLLILSAEEWIMDHTPISLNNIDKLANDFIEYNIYKQDIYNYQSYQGVSDDDDDEGLVSLPEELKDFKGYSMVLKIEDMDKVIDTFCSRNTYYRRAFAILADLDKEVLKCVDTGLFPSWVLIPYKDGGDAIFQFSHFEIDLREPDENYRTLYVVYRYDTTAS